MQEPTRTRPRLSAAGKLNVTGMVVAAAGIIIQIASGSDLYPTIPPGPIILLAGAALVALGPWRWTPVVGVVVPLFLLVGAAIAAVVSGEFVDQLTDPGEVGIFAGDVLQLLGMITALVAGIVALGQSSRTRTWDRHEQRD
jgi:small-conductance mechanosensitive channel